MNFVQLTELFNKLNTTNQRLLLTEFMSKFFKKIKKSEDLKTAVYLIQGMVFPEKSDKKIGVGESMMIDIISEFTGHQISYIKTQLASIGDLGEVAEILMRNPKQAQLFKTPKLLDINLLLETLQSLSEISGADSNLRKKRVITSVLAFCGFEDAKYLVKIILGNLRLGVSTYTIIDALASAFAKKTTDKIKIEKAYMFSPDLGNIAQKLFDGGLEEIEQVEMEYGGPIKMMLASRVDYDKIIKEHGGVTSCEWKLDGERAQIHRTGNKVVIYSRQLNDITHQYPDLIEPILESIIAKNCILEGEIVAVKGNKFLPFQTLMRRKRKEDIEEIAKEVPVKLYLFDILKDVDKDYTNAPYHLRRNVLGKLFQDTDKIILVPARDCHVTYQVAEFFKKARDSGCEGIIAKNRAGHYTPGKRTKDWIKMKAIEGGKMDDTLDVVIIGGFHGKGRRAKHAGSFLTAVYDEDNKRFVAFSNIGSGFTDEQIIELTPFVEKYATHNKPPQVYSEVKPDLWVAPYVVIEIIADEIQYTEIMDQGKLYSTYKPRFPVFKRVRSDKKPTQITTLKEIIDMYNRQGNNEIKTQEKR